MSEREEIKVFWEGPFTIDEILEGNIDCKYEVKSDSVGLYQIYGLHPLYGDNVLVYIGRTVDKNGFKSRLKDRWVIQHGSDSKNVRIYLGKIYSDHTDVVSSLEKKIEKAEVLLINTMKPAYNSSNIQSVKEGFIRDNFILHNVGNYRDLYPILDSKYFWEQARNLTMVDKVSKILNISINIEDDFYGFYLSNTKKINIKANYKIWFGVDYNKWNEDMMPLVLEITSDNETIQKKIDALEIDYFQFPFDEDILNLKDKDFINSFETKVNAIISSIKI